MDDKEFRKLRREDLIEIIYQYQRREQRLVQENEHLRSQLEDRRIKTEKSGSIAEAALALSGIFEAAQKAADLYLESVKAKSAEPAASGKTEEKTAADVKKTADPDQAKEALKVPSKDLPKQETADKKAPAVKQETTDKKAPASKKEVQIGESAGKKLPEKLAAAEKAPLKKADAPKQDGLESKDLPEKEEEKTEKTCREETLRKEEPQKASSEKPDSSDRETKRIQTGGRLRNFHFGRKQQEAPKDIKSAEKKQETHAAEEKAEEKQNTGKAVSPAEPKPEEKMQTKTAEKRDPKDSQNLPRVPAKASADGTSLKAPHKPEEPKKAPAEIQKKEAPKADKKETIKIPDLDFGRKPAKKAPAAAKTPAKAVKTAPAGKKPQKAGSSDNDTDEFIASLKEYLGM